MAIVTVAGVWGATFGGEWPIESHSGRNVAANLFRTPAAGDLDGDGDLDVVATLDGGYVRWFENPYVGGPWPSHWIGISPGGNPIQVGDVNGDSHLDLVVGGDALTVWINSGDHPPAFSLLTVSTLPFNRFALVRSATGGADLVAASDTLPLTLFTNGGGLTPSFSSEEIGGTAAAVAGGDFDGDGAAEFASADGSLILWWEDQGLATPRFVSHPVYAAGAGLLAAGDVDGDGRLDLVSDALGKTSFHGNEGGSPLAWKYGVVRESAPVGGISVSDIDGDGDGDVLTCYDIILNSEGSWSAVRLQQDQFFTAIGWSASTRYGLMIGADFDGDGFRDIMSTKAYQWRQGALVPPIPFETGWDATLLARRNNSDLLIASATFADSSGDGIVTPGEPGDLVVGIVSQAAATIEDVSAEATCSNPRVSVEPGPHSLAAIGALMPAEIRIPFTTDAEATLGAQISAEVTLRWRNQIRMAPSETRTFGFFSHESAAAEESPEAAIPDNDPNGLTRTLDIDAPGGAITAVHVDLDISHPYRGEVLITLTHPGGAMATLFNRPGEVGADIRLTVDTNAFNGLPASGTYTLKIVDSGPGDVGTLNRWVLRVDNDVLRATAWQPEQILSALEGDDGGELVLDLNHDGRIDVADLVTLINARR
jgi:subtilisin-like proprotein convertase family protein